jgi:uncharacterized protein
MDMAALDAIDVHVHVQASVRAPGGPSERLQEMSKYFRAEDVAAHTVPSIAEYYRSRRMAAVVFGVDTVADGEASRKPSNEEIAELAAEHADVLVPFASVDPARGADAVARARRLASGGVVRGFKFHPNANTLLKEKVLFGSDFLVITPDRWLADLDRTEIRESVRPLILKDSAVRLLGLGG